MLAPRYAKYVDVNSSDPDFTSLLAQIAHQISNGATSSGLVVDGGSFSESTQSFPFAAEASQNTAGSMESGPKAYLIWLVFDRDYNLILEKCGYDRLSSTPKESGQNVAHESLYSPEITIEEAGYVYIFLSNEESATLEVYFDDFNVEHVKSQVEQMGDYYPFGLTFNSYSRENSIRNMYQYSGKEKQDELGLDWLDYGARMYMADIARWGTIDPLSENSISMTPYHFVVNNPIIFVRSKWRRLVLLQSGWSGRTGLALP